jgi:hypothetical protein
MQISSLTLSLPSIARPGLLVTSTLMGCSYLAANISGRYIQCYAGPSLSQQLVAVVAFADLADDSSNPAPDSFRVNGVTTKLARAIELVPGEHDITMLYRSIEGTVHVNLKAWELYLAGGKRAFAVDYVYGKYTGQAAWERTSRQNTVREARGSRPTRERNRTWAPATEPRGP